LPKRNFPDLARFYYQNVINRGRAPRVGSALLRGMESGEFRKMDVETAIDVVIAPILMLLIWRYSMNCCENSEVHPETYLQIHMDLLRHGLRGRKRRLGYNFLGINILACANIMPAETHMNIEQARFNMIEQQIRPWRFWISRFLTCSLSSSAKTSHPPPTATGIRRHGNRSVAARSCWHRKSKQK
jgi:hypothetical protein